MNLADSILLKHKMIVIGLLIIAVAGYFSFTFYTQNQQEQERIEVINMDVESISREKIDMQVKIKDIKKQTQALKQKIDDYDQKVQQIHKGIAEVKPERDRLLKEVTDKEKTLAALNEKLDAAKRQESELDVEFEESMSEYRDTVNQIEVTREDKIALEKKIRGYSKSYKGVELKKIVVKVTPPLEGEVVEVNAEYRFAVIDLGSRDSLESGEIMGIYRQSNLVAKAVVENIYEDMSSIIVLDGWSDAQVLIGDTARLLK